MESKIRQSIIQTVLYFDIFDYPITAAQIWKYLATAGKIKRRDFEKVLSLINSPVVEKEGWYFLSGRENLIRKRLLREKESRKKLVLIYKAISVLSFIPTVLFIGVSGGVSMHNADKKDDIDIFLITKGNTIWQTRLFSVLILTILRRYRKRSDRQFTNKICLNMLIDERGLIFPKDRQDLYTAHEIIQMKPIFNRNKTYEKFTLSNSWVKEFLPNAVIKKSLKIRRKKNNIVTDVIEFLARSFQFWYIKRHVSRETIKNEMLAFHPEDKKGKILKAYETRLKKYGQ